MIHDYILSHFFVLHPHEDTIAAAAETNDELTAYVEKILDSIAEIEDEKKFWVLRLSMMSHLQLSREDVQELSRFGGHSFDNLTSRLASIMEGVEAKEEKRIKAAGKAVLMWHEIGRMEALLNKKTRTLPVQIRRRFKKSSWPRLRTDIIT